MKTHAVTFPFFARGEATEASTERPASPGTNHPAVDVATFASALGDATAASRLDDKGHVPEKGTAGHVVAIVPDELADEALVDATETETVASATPDASALARATGTPAVAPHAEALAGAPPVARRPGPSPAAAASQLHVRAGAAEPPRPERTSSSSGPRGAAHELATFVPRDEPLATSSSRRSTGSFEHRKPREEVRRPLDVSAAPRQRAAGTGGGDAPLLTGQGARAEDASEAAHRATSHAGASAGVAPTAAIVVALAAPSLAPPALASEPLRAAEPQPPAQPTSPSPLASADVPLPTAPRLQSKRREDHRPDRPAEAIPLAPPSSAEPHAAGPAPRARIVASPAAAKTSASLPAHPPALSGSPSSASEPPRSLLPSREDAASFASPSERASFVGSAASEGAPAPGRPPRRESASARPRRESPTGRTAAMGAVGSALASAAPPHPMTALPPTQVAPPATAAPMGVAETPTRRAPARHDEAAFADAGNVPASAGPGAAVSSRVPAPQQGAAVAPRAPFPQPSTLARAEDEASPRRASRSSDPPSSPTSGGARPAVSLAATASFAAEVAGELVSSRPVSPPASRSRSVAPAPSEVVSGPSPPSLPSRRSAEAPPPSPVGPPSLPASADPRLLAFPHAHPSAFVDPSRRLASSLPASSKRAAHREDAPSPSPTSPESSHRPHQPFTPFVGTFASFDKVPSLATIAARAARRPSDADDVAATPTSPDKPAASDAMKQLASPAPFVPPAPEPRPSSHKALSESRPSSPSWMGGGAHHDAGVPIQGGIAGASAHLALDLGHAATLSLHLRVKDGVADVRIEGAGPEHDLFRRREVATALRQEGLSLGGWEVHAGAAPPSDMAPVRPAALPSPAASSNLGTPLAQGHGQALRATTAAAEEGVRRAAGAGGATVVTPPASGRRQATGAARANQAVKEEDRDGETEARAEREGLHVTA